MKARVLLIAGWSYGPEDLEPVTAALRAGFEVEAVRAESAQDQPEPSATIIVGWSLGGMRAIEAAAGSPGRIAGIVLVSTTPRFVRGEGWPHGVEEGRVRALARNVRRDGRSALVSFDRDAAAPHEPLGPGTPALSLPGDRAAAGGLPAARAAVLLSGIQYLRAADLRVLVPGLRLPCIVLHGLEDRIISWQSGEWLATNAPRARWRPVAGVGHDLPLRRPDLVRCAVEEILESSS